MIVSMHQPQYIPWLGFFDKIASSDAFVFLDCVQYKKREFQNRNKLRTKGGWCWLTVPVITKGRYFQLIKDVEIDNDYEWQRKHLKTIESNYAKSNYFDEFFPFLEKIYVHKWKFLTALNIEIILLFLKYLNIEKPVYYESKLGIHSKKTERIIEICKRLKADIYLSGSGGRDYLQQQRFQEEKIKLFFQEYKHPVYKQMQSPFIAYLSIIDLIFSHGKDSLKILRG